MRIAIAPDPILTRHCRDVRSTRDWAEADAFLAAALPFLTALVHRGQALGIAANQLHHDQRILMVADTTEADLRAYRNDPTHSAPPPILTMVDPILNEPTGEIASEEGCLSLPGLHMTLPRHAVITATYTPPDAPGTRVRRRADGLLARVLQHEVDHLNGILITDYIGRPGVSGPDDDETDDETDPDTTQP